MLKEFRDFILTGNVIDFAVAVIMAGAVGLVVAGFVDDIIMPIIGEILGGKNLDDFKYVLSAASGVEGEPQYKPENAILIGKWIGTIINLIIVGAVMFAIVKAYNRFNNKADEAAETSEALLAEIRDLLKNQK